MSTSDQVLPLTMTDTEIAAHFPGDFLWGAATAAYQIEGAASEDGRLPSTWDYFSTIPGKVYHGDNGMVAADHYHRMPEDVALMAEMGLKSYRFSLSWSRIFPSGTGDVNTRGLDFYDRLVDTLLASNIVPLATIYHWDLPMALHEKGGWLHRDTAYAFADYAEAVVSRLGDRVNWWATLNEPWCNAYLGYGIGVHAPGLRDMQMAVVAGHHMLLGHGLALPRLRAHTGEQAQLGITLNLSPIYAYDEHAATLQGVEIKDTIQNRWMLDPLYKGRYPEHLFTYLGTTPPPMQDDDLTIIASPFDFLGINYYSRVLVRGHAQTTTVDPSAYEEITRVDSSQYTAMGWEVYPDGLTTLLQRVHHDYAPGAILITENGAAFDDDWDGNGHVNDQERIQYLREHIQAVGKALAQGVPIRGYYAWSLMDNFEWAEGYSKRFGIVYIDYPSQRRIVKASGRWYANFLAQAMQNKSE